MPIVRLGNVPAGRPSNCRKAAQPLTSSLSVKETWLIGGYFLDYIARTSFLDSSAEAGSYVTSGNVDGYLVELKARVSSVTAYGNIHKLRRITQLIAPGKRLEWLREIEQDLDWDKQPASKFNRIVDSDSVVRAGLALMEEAEMAQHLTPLGCARNYRNGLMIALPAVMPIHLKNFSALTVGRNLSNIETPGIS